VWTLDRLEQGAVKSDELWPFDAAHPDDAGYRLFADAAWAGYRQAVAEGRVCRAPGAMLHGDSYMTWSRNPLAALPPLPRGWSVARTLRVAAYHDALMSRWLDDEVRAANWRTVTGPDGAPWKEAAGVAPLQFGFRARTVMLYGTKTLESCPYRVRIDGRPVPTPPPDSAPVFEANSSRFGGNTHLSPLVVTGLDAAVEHTLEIEPLFAPGRRQELRLESVCLAGGPAALRNASAEH
jgi:hypothetical protein